MRIDRLPEARKEWRQGWPTAFSAVFGMYLCVMFLYSVGLFIKPLETEFGWKREQIAIGVTIASLTGAAMHPVAGMLVDRFGARKVAIPGIIAYSVAIGLLSLAGPAVWTWWALCVLVGLGFASASSTVWVSATVANFSAGRGMALAAVQVGPALSMATMPLIMHHLISNFGWRAAYLFVTFFGLVIVLPVALAFFQRRPATMGGAPTVRSAATAADMQMTDILRSTSFWTLAAVAFFAVLGLNGLSLHFVPILATLNISTATAASIASLIGIGSIIGRVSCGFLLDQIPAHIVGAAAFMLPVLSCAILLTGQHDMLMLSATALFLGLTLGAEIDTIAYLAARNFGLARYGTAFGLLTAFMSLGSGVGPWLAGAVFDRTGDYKIFQLGTIATFTLAALLIASLRPRSAEANGCAAMVPEEAIS